MEQLYDDRKDLFITADHMKNIEMAITAKANGTCPTDVNDSPAIADSYDRYVLVGPLGSDYIARRRHTARA